MKKKRINRIKFAYCFAPTPSQAQVQHNCSYESSFNRCLATVLSNDQTRSLWHESNANYILTHSCCGIQALREEHVAHRLNFNFQKILYILIWLKKASRLYLTTACQDAKISARHSLYFDLLCVSETLPNLFFSWLIQMRSASFCLVKGQETQLS